MSLNLPTTGSHASNGVGNPFCWCRFPARFSKPHTGPYTGFSLFCSVSLSTFPLRGKTGLFSNLGYPGFARLAHNCPTRLQQGGFAASLVSFPYPASKIAHRLSQGRVWFSPPFSPNLSRWEPGQLALQLVIHRLMNGQDRVKQRSVSRRSVQCPHRCRQGFDIVKIS